MSCIIYKLCNKKNNKVYIGQTWQTLEKRSNSGFGYSNSPHINNAIKYYGWKEFYYEILDETDNQDFADWLEISYINCFDSINNGYNITTGGIDNVMKGRKHSIQSRLLISNAHKGKKTSNITKNKMSKSRLGKKRPNIGLANKGKKRTEKTKKILSVKAKNRNTNIIIQQIERCIKNAKNNSGKTWKIISGKRVWMDI